MMTGGRGGYCFEQNMLFRAGLRSIGFDITSLQGRFVRALAIDVPRPAIQMVLQVNLPEGPHIADLGFGNLAPTCALRLDTRTGAGHPTSGCASSMSGRADVHAPGHEHHRGSAASDGRRLTMFNERTNLGRANGGVERRVLRDEFGLARSDDELGAIIGARAAWSAGVFAPVLRVI